MSNEKKGLFSGKGQRNPKVSAGLRAVAGVYLVYLAYQLFDGLKKGESEGAVLWGAIIVFGVCGALFAFLGIKDLIMNREVRDLSEFEEDEDEEEDEELADETKAEKEEPVRDEKPAKLSIAERAKLTDRISDDAEEE